jgi:O-antigen ligase
MAVLVYLVAPDSVWKRFSTLKTAASSELADYDPETVDLATRQDQGSSEQRLAIWQVASAVIMENPLTGVGLGAYPAAHEVTARKPGFKAIAAGRRDTHSTYLNILAETGIPGFVLFASIIILTLKQARAVRRRVGKAAPALSLQLFNMEVGLYAFLVAGIWGTYGYLVPLYMHLVLIHVGSQLLLEQAAPPQPQRGRAQRTSYSARGMVGRNVEASA